MSTQRKLFISELMWLDTHEPFFREAYVTHHYVPLVAEFNAKTSQNFSCGTIRNRLQSYRTWKDKKTRGSLHKGPKKIDLTTPEKLIKRERLTESDENNWMGKIHRKLSKELDEDVGFKQQVLSIDSDEESSIKAIFPGKVIIIFNTFNN
jgi:hypothetical protein